MVTYNDIINIYNREREVGRMVIKGARTIAEYKLMQAEKIQNWIDSNFFEGSVTWEMDGANAIKVTDKTGDSMIVSMDEIR